MDTQKITIIGLGIGIVLVIQFFLISDFMDRKEDQSPEIFQKGYDLGIENTIKSLFVKTDDCQTAEIFINETSRVLIDFSCLNISP